MTPPDPVDPSAPDLPAVSWHDGSDLDGAAGAHPKRWRSRPVDLLGDAALNRVDANSWFGSVFDA